MHVYARVHTSIYIYIQRERQKKEHGLPRQVTMWEDRDFKMQEEKAEEKTEERKRRISTEEIIKAPKKIKAKEAETPHEDDVAAAGTIAPDLGLKNLKDMPQGTQKRLLKKLEAAQPLAIEFTSKIAEAKAPDYTDYVPKAKVRKFEELQSTFQSLLEKAVAYSTSLKCDKSEFSSFFTEFQNTIKQVEEAAEKLAEYVADAKETIGAAA